MQSWRARIDSTDGGVLGTGFLIDAGRVMTCAHVVGDRPTVSVVFLDNPDLPVVPATVEFRGPYTADRKTGDLAVLELAHDVQLQPARLAGINTLARHRLDPALGELHVYGFPRGFDQEGVDTRVRAPYQDVHAGEWAQLEPLDGHSLPLQRGFSGAAVTLAGTGEIVGMVVGADRSQSGIGKMLPIGVMWRYWRELGDYLPLKQLPDAAARALREVLGGLELPVQPAELYRASLRDGLGPAGRDFRTLWEAAIYVAEEVVAAEDAPLERFLTTVAGHLGASPERTGLEAWMRVHLGTAPSVPPVQVDNGNREAAILIRVTPSAVPARCTLAISIEIDDSQRVLHNGVATAPEVRGIVETTLEQAFGLVPLDIPRDNLLIQFELPLSWLVKPVDEWYANRQDKLPIGWSYPVIVRDLHSATARDRPRLVHQRWEVLREQNTATLNAVTCRDPRDRRTLTAWLLTSDRQTVLVFPGRPTRPDLHPALRAGLSAGIPVMLWSRERCTERHTNATPCAGDQFIDAVTKAVATVAPTRLPQKVRELRASAHAGLAGHNCGRALTLFWDNPKRFALAEGLLTISNSTSEG